MRVLVLLGGSSAEREVSLDSGRAVLDALAAKGHEAIAYDPGRKNFPLRKAAAGGPVPGDPDPGLSWGAALASVVEPLRSRIDVVFIALHGGAGEDGAVQAVLESLGVPYTGSGPLASGIAMDKRVTKILFEAGELATPPWRLWDPGSDLVEADALPVVDPLGGWPVVVKPVAEGSSVGVSIVGGFDGLPAAIRAVRKATGVPAGDLLVERFIPGREIAVGILGSRPLPPIEIIPKEGFYDYTRKYTPGASEYVIPAAVPAQVLRALEQIGWRAFRCLGCRGFGRVDLRLDPEGRPFLLEVNTIPGMTATSLLPKAAKEEGLSFPELIEEICRLAVESPRPVPDGPHAPSQETR
jgi:D-alanine-D-alanine ligase